MAKTKLEHVWWGMHVRCRYPSFIYYDYYGGRGITVCAEWASFAPFEEWALASGYREGLQIDRIDNDGDYTPENCRWVTARENALNRRSTHSITAFGETKSVVEWSEDPRCVVGYSTLYRRLVIAGWPAKRAITQPSRNRPRR